MQLAYTSVTPRREKEAAAAAKTDEATTAAATAAPVQAAVSLDLFSNANDVVVVKDEKMRGLTRTEDEVPMCPGRWGS